MSFLRQAIQPGFVIHTLSGGPPGRGVIFGRDKGQIQRCDRRLQHLRSSALLEAPRARFPSAVFECSNPWNDWATSRLSARFTGISSQPLVSHHARPGNHRPSRAARLRIAIARHTGARHCLRVRAWSRRQLHGLRQSCAVTPRRCGSDPVSDTRRAGSLVGACRSRRTPLGALAGLASYSAHRQLGHQLGPGPG